MKHLRSHWTENAAAVLLSAVLFGAMSPASAQIQRVLGLDVSTYQGNLSTTTWATFKRPTNQSLNGVFGDGRDFVIIRSSRGGTTGEDHRQGGYPSGNNTFYNLSQRYDDPYFVQNVNRATAAGLYAGSYHFDRADILANTLNSDGVTTAGVASTGTDEADHLIQMAGAWMRPGYLLPVLDLESGAIQRTTAELSVWAVAFSDRIYQQMGIRAMVYANSSYVNSEVNSTVPAVIPNLWIARPSSGDPLTTQPPPALPTYPNVYGVWNPSYPTIPNPEPWKFWQYNTGPGLNGYSGNIDKDAANGGIEFLKDYLVPAVWMNDSSGDWSALTNWNSGQIPAAPVTGAGQLTPIGTQTLPIARLPGAAGSGVTSGQHDTVILERPSANILVTLSSGTHNIRKLYMRETLNITGGSLNINYVPSSDSTTNSAQFSGPVTLSGSGSLSLHTLQVDATRTFTLGGGTVTFDTIKLMPHSTVPAKILLSGDVNLNARSDVTAIIANGTGTGSSGLIDLGGATRSFNVGNGTNDVDLSIDVPISTGALTKTGAGTMRLGAANTFAGNVTINGGTLRYGHSSGLSSTAVVTVNNGGNLDMNGISDSVAALASAAGQTTGTVTQGAASLTLTAASGTSTFAGVITGTGTFTKNGASTQILNGNNSLVGSVVVNGGSLVFNGTSTTGAVTVNSGTLGGIGTISGAIAVQSGGTISPGASIGTLTLNSVPMFNGTTFVEIDRNGGSPLADKIVLTSGTLNYGGALVVTNIGATLTGGEMFTNFNATSGSYTGAFVTNTLPILTNGLNWYLGHLTTNGTIKVNRRPVANSVIVTNNPTQVLQISVASLTSNATDADGDSIALANFDSVTTNGITLVESNAFLLYSNDMSVADKFSYTINDGHGGIATNTVQIVPSTTGRFTSLPTGNSNSVTLHLAGLPGWTYYVDRSTNLPAWLTIWTNVAPANGLFDYVDDFQDLGEPPSAAFYRLRWPQ
ncbi:MAG: GH25 family lysozyme [Verrucomicrobiota bacterium]